MYTSNAVILYYAYNDNNYYCFLNYYYYFYKYFIIVFITATMIVRAMLQLLLLLPLLPHYHYNYYFYAHGRRPRRGPGGRSPKFEVGTVHTSVPPIFAEAVLLEMCESSNRKKLTFFVCEIYVFVKKRVILY